LWGSTNQREDQRLSALRFNLIRYFAKRRFGAGGEGEVHSLGGKRLGDGASESFASPRDEGDFSGE